MPLLSEINAPAIEQRVLRAARVRLGAGRYQADFEHGQWWITRLGDGGQWAVVDAVTPGGDNYLDFEQVTEGDESR